MSDYDLPVGWASTTPSAMFECWGGMTPSTGVDAYWDGTIPWVSSKDVKAWKVDGASERLTEKALAETRLRRCPVGSVLVVVRSGVLAHTLPVAITTVPVVINQDLKALASRSLEMNRWLALYLRAHEREILTANRKEGTTVQSIRVEQLLDRDLPVAPLAEQRRIVQKVEALLEQVNRAKERLDRVPLILKRFRQAVLAAACSGELTRGWRERHPSAVGPSLTEPPLESRRGRRGANLSGDGVLLVDDEMPELPEAWRYVRVDRLTEPGTVITYGIVLPGPEIDGGVPYVRGQDVEDGWLRTGELRHTTREIVAKHHRSALREGDVLLCIIRNLRVAIVPTGIDGANITQGMVRIRTSPVVVEREFLAAYLRSPIAQAWMKRRYFGMDMPRINVEDARAVPVPLPPLEEQTEIVRQVRRLFALADAIEHRVDEAMTRAENLPQAILSKAFSGELVPTEAELARAEGRSYETAEEMLTRVSAEAAEIGAAPKRRKRAAGARGRG